MRHISQARGRTSRLRVKNERTVIFVEESEVFNSSSSVTRERQCSQAPHRDLLKSQIALSLWACLRWFTEKPGEGNYLTDVVNSSELRETSGKVKLQ